MGFFNKKPEIDPVNPLKEKAKVRITLEEGEVPLALLDNFKESLEEEYNVVNWRLYDRNNGWSYNTSFPVKKVEIID